MATKSLQPHLSSFSIRGYRSLRNVAFNPSCTLSVLIGANGSGKTNVLQALRLLNLSNSSRIRSPAERASATRCEIAAAFRIGSKQLGYRSTVLLARSETNNDQIVVGKEEWNLTEFGDDGGWREIPRYIFDPDFSRHVVSLTRRRVVTSSRPHPSRALIPDIVARRALQAVIQFTESIRYYSASQFTDPSKCPSSFEIEENNRVVESYTNRGPHLSFLADLYRLFRNSPGTYKSYLEFVGPTGIGLLHSIEWKHITLSSSTVDVKTGGKIVKRKKNRILIVPIVHFRKSHLSFNQLSEGTFRTLALIFYLMTSPAGLLLIEEPEVCVHHGLLKSVVEAIKAQSARKQVIVSTHSELVLDSVTPENVFSVTNLSTRGTAVKHLPKSMSVKDYSALKNYLKTAGSLGEYWTHGGMS